MREPKEAYRIERTGIAYVCGDEEREGRYIRSWKNNEKKCPRTWTADIGMPEEKWTRFLAKGRRADAGRREFYESRCKIISKSIWRKREKIWKSKGWKRTR